MDLDTEEHGNDDHTPTGAGERYLQELGAFNRLPLRVIKQILYAVDANTFASLTVLNRQWRKVTSDRELYAHHLSRCPLFATSQVSAPIKSHSLEQLKHKFARQVRKNAFDLYLRPRTTLVKLISSSVGSSAALPTGEALKFDFSANGHILLCLSSSRIFVLDVAAPGIKVLYELKTSRMPLAATILDNGRVLAVVSHRHQVNIYHLSKREAKHVQALTLNDVPRALALAPTGSVLAIAYDGSIEVHALGEEVITTQCRAVRCGKIDTLSFSSDGSMLLGSSLDQPDGGFVTITAPFPTDSMVDVSNYEAHIWTTQILFPDVISGYSHVTLLSSQVAGDDNWVIAFDGNLKTFRAVRPSDPKAGSTYFPGPVSQDGLEECMPSLGPAVDSNGELVALAFRGSGLWLYGLPDDLNINPLEFNGTIGVNDHSVSAQARGQIRNGDCDETITQKLRQVLDQPSLMIEGRKVADIQGLTAARWVARRRWEDDPSHPQRLVAVAPGGVTSSSLGDETIPVDGGRISIFDFQPSAEDGKTIEILIELGEDEPLILREPDANLEQEVELERRRTQLRRGATGPPRTEPGESQSVPRPPLPDMINHRRSHSSGSPVLDAEISDVTLFLEGPYSNTAPRSRDTLQRAATAAASNRRPQHPMREEERPRLPVLHIPHESDADNWVPPPPPYTRNPDQPLPEHLRQMLLSAMTAPPGGAMDDIPQQIRRASTNQADRPEGGGSGGGSGILSRRWSTRRRTTDVTADARSSNRLSFRPLSFHRAVQSSAGNSESQHQPSSTARNQSTSTSGVAIYEQLNQPVVSVPFGESDRPFSAIPRQTVRQSPTDSGTLTASSGIPRRQLRNSRIFGNLRKSSNESPYNQEMSNNEQQQDSNGHSPRRNRSIMRNSRFSRSSPNLPSFGNAGINRMSTIYSNASRPSDQNGQVQRTRSRSEVTQPPARLTEEALRYALSTQNADGRRSSRNLQPQPMPVHHEQQQQFPEQQQQQSTLGDAWQVPNQMESEEWRARIEAWNMNTISERKRSRSKTGRCTLM